MELEQMKIVTFAMIKYPCSQDFIRPVPMKNIYYHKYIKFAWAAAPGPSQLPACVFVIPS